MKTQTAKQFVMERYQYAHLYRRSKDKKCVILDGFNLRNPVAIGIGDTPNQAWQNAKSKIEEMEKKNE